MRSAAAVSPRYRLIVVLFQIPLVRSFCKEIIISLFAVGVYSHFHSLSIGFAIFGLTVNQGIIIDMFSLSSSASLISVCLLPSS